MIRSLLVSAITGILLVFGVATLVRGQQAVIRDTDDGIKYARGQNVVPAFEGWVPNPDGTFSLVFGYFNRNWEEELSIPIGPDNHIDPGGPDQGQPTYFAARRGKNVFEIVVPKDFGKKEVIWTITSRGKTEKAYGALVPQEVLSRHMVLAGGSLSADAAAGNDNVGDEKDPNRPPAISIEPVRSASVNSPANLTATVTDDGVGAVRGRGARALRLNWSIYRGPAKVLFNPDRSDLPSQTGGKTSTTVTFKVPGTYTLRASVTDGGGLEGKKDVSVVVK
jgi:hypothetical protein